MSLRPGPKESALLLILRLGLAGVFGFAAYQKLIGPFWPWALPENWNPKAAPADFQASIEAFRLIPESQHHLVMVATFAIPWAEVLCAVLLVLGLWTRASAFLLSVALAGFVVAIKSALDRGLDFPCGCFGKINFPCPSDKLTDCAIYRNAALLLPALYILIRGAGRLSIDRAITPRKPAEAPPADRPPRRKGKSLTDVPGT